MEVRATLEDLMYVSILEKFVVLGVEMLPRLDGESDSESESLSLSQLIQQCYLPAGLPGAPLRPPSPCTPSATSCLPCQSTHAVFSRRALHTPRVG